VSGHDDPPLEPPRHGASFSAIEVWAGIGLAVVLIWGLRIPLLVFDVGGGMLALFGVPNGDDAGFFLAWGLPIVVLAGAIVLAARSGRKGLAVGMTIYAALAVLFMAACFSIVSMMH